MGGVWRDNLGEKPAAIWMRIGGRGLSVIVADRSNVAQGLISRWDDRCCVAAIVVVTL